MKTDRSLVKASDGWPASMFPETSKAISGPEPGSSEAKALDARDAEIRNQAILTALRMAGVGLLAGGGTRLLQEGLGRFFKRPEKGYSEEISVDIHRPGSKSKRRGREKKSAMEDVTDWPPYYPLLLGGTGLGIYGGYKGVQEISDWLKKKELESEMQAARQEYEEALDERYAASRQKQSSLNQIIDSSYERWLNEGETIKEAGMLGTLGGLGIGTAALIWLLSHKAAYDRLRKSDPEAFRKKVLEQRRRVRQAVSPPPILFEMEPELEEEEEEKPKALPKAAAEELVGGLGDDQSAKDLAKQHETTEKQILDQLSKGIDVEMEHTDSPAESEEIAKDHIAEHPEYYDHLEEMEEEAEKEEKAAAAAGHSCGSCVYFNRGVCEKQDEVIEKVGEDNLTIYLSKPTQTNSCPVFEQESQFDHPEGSGPDVSEETKEALLKSALMGTGPSSANLAQQVAGVGSDIFGAGKSWVQNQALKNPAIQRRISQAAREAANDPQTLQPAAKAIANDPEFQQGMNEAAMAKVQSIPLLGGLFGQ